MFVYRRTIRTGLRDACRSVNEAMLQTNHVNSLKTSKSGFGLTKFPDVFTPYSRFYSQLSNRFLQPVLSCIHHVGLLIVDLRYRYRYSMRPKTAFKMCEPLNLLTPCSTEQSKHWYKSWAQCPNLQNILRQPYEYLTIMTKLRSTNDACLIYETSYTAFSYRYDSLAKS